MQPLLESQKKPKRKDNMCSFLLGFPHCSRQLCSPWACRTTLFTPDKSTLAEKKYQDTKALYVMLSSYIDFSPLVCLTDIIKSLFHVMSSWAPEIALGLPVSLNASQMCLGRDFCEDMLTVGVIHFSNMFVAFTHKQVFKPLCRK